MDVNRIQKIKESKAKKGPVLYWMTRDQRVYDNWSLLFAQKIAKENNMPLMVMFCFNPSYIHAGLRHYDFLITGLLKVERQLKELNIPFYLLTGVPRLVIPEFINKYKVSDLITDFDPLKTKRIWQRDVVRIVNISIYEVDSHNIIPCWTASNKMEAGAYTIRPKIEKLLPYYLEEYPIPEAMPKVIENEETNWEEALKYFNPDEGIKPVPDYVPGEDEALNVLKNFIENKLEKYSEFRNDPVKDVQSGLSPYLHYGHISSQRIALNLQKLGLEETASGFLEELIIRKELADNFCYYNTKYDLVEGFPDWAIQSLNKHRADKREYLYSSEEFENARTHSSLWNSAQTELLKTGKIHGYMRMYWAKKILEWGKDPEESLKIANYLNDKYSLDGRDPNGYTGCAWSIGGVHDRAWAERPVLGKIRYMNEAGCRRKFDVDLYIEKVSKYK